MPNKINQAGAGMLKKEARKCKSCGSEFTPTEKYPQNCDHDCYNNEN